MSLKIALFVFIAIPSICNFANGLNCYFCTDVKTCEKPNQIECNPLNANYTRAYLNNFYKININATSPNYDCLNHNLTLANQQPSLHRGCVYRLGNACDLQFKDEIATNSTKRECKQCSGNLCNGSGSVFGSTATIFVSVVLALIGKSFV